MKPTQILEHSTLQKTFQPRQPLREFVEQTLGYYFQHIDPSLPPIQLYNLVLEEVELPLLKCTLNFTKNNQCKAAALLGISRSTLRKKLKQYSLDEKDTQK